MSIVSSSRSTVLRSLASRHRTLATSSDASHQGDLRSILLDAAIKHVPTHGFSMKAFQAGIEALPTELRRSLAASPSSFSPMSIEQMFPSLPVRRLPSFLSRFVSSSSSAGAKAPLSEGAGETHIEKERLGPSKALFDAWSEKARDELREELASEAGTSSPPVQRLREAFQKRLEHNLPVLPFLPEALATLSVPDANKASFPSLSGYLSHVQSIARDIQDLTKADISLIRLATIYSLAEIYQISRAQPDISQVMQRVDKLMGDTAGLQSGVRDTGEFVGYVGASLRSILKSRGL